MKIPATFRGWITGRRVWGRTCALGRQAFARSMKKAVAEKNKTFWEELIWREFFMQILDHFPETVDTAFRKKYDRVEYRNNEEEF